jgi:cyclase
VTLLRRVIACLDVEDGRVVKGTRFVGLRDVGDPVELAARYEAAGADEILFLDIAATPSARATMLDLARRTAERLFIPLTIGGGIRSAGEMSEALRAGADKVALNTAAVRRPSLITECADRFGAQCVVASIDALRTGDGWQVCIEGGRTPVRWDAIAWARECAERGAGEILVTSIDRDGSREGYDLELTRRVADAVPVPVIASGGAGDAGHLRDAFTTGGADAVLVAGILHDGTVRLDELKVSLHDASITVRGVAA